LGKLYLKKGRILEGKKLLFQALRNVKKVYVLQDLKDYDSSDIENFMDSQIKGTFLSESNYQKIQNLLMS